MKIFSSGMNNIVYGFTFAPKVSYEELKKVVENNFEKDFKKMSCESKEELISFSDENVFLLFKTDKVQIGFIKQSSFEDIKKMIKKVKEVLVNSFKIKKCKRIVCELQAHISSEVADTQKLFFNKFLKHKESDLNELFEMKINKPGVSFNFESPDENLLVKLEKSFKLEEGLYIKLEYVYITKIDIQEITGLFDKYESLIEHALELIF